MSAFNSSYNLALYDRDIPVKILPEVSAAESIRGRSEPAATTFLSIAGESIMAAVGTAAAIAFIRKNDKETVAGYDAAAAGVSLKAAGINEFTGFADTSAVVWLAFDAKEQISGSASTGADCRLYVDSFEMITSGALIDSFQETQEGNNEP